MSIKIQRFLVLNAILWSFVISSIAVHLIPPLNDASDCSGPSSVLGAGLALAQKSRVIAEEILKKFGPLGLIMDSLSLVLDILPSDGRSLANCILNQVQHNINQHEYTDLMNIIDGYISNFERNVVRELQNARVQKENCDGDNCAQVNFESMSEHVQDELWDDLESVVNGMDVQAGLFKGSNSAYGAGYYYALPYFATTHLHMLVLQIDLSTKLEKTDKSRQTAYLKQDLGSFIRYYSEICLRFWRIARDNFCQNDDADARILCMSQPAPYHQFLDEWAKLADSFGQSEVKAYILGALSDNKIFDNHWIALKSVKKAKEHYAIERDVTSKENFVWLSCNKKRAYCYLRDCPGQYYKNRWCTGEQFRIQKGAAGEVITSGDKIGLQSTKGNWLSMYWNVYCYCAKSTGFCYDQGGPWWTSRSCPNSLDSSWPSHKSGCSAEVHYIYKLNSENNILQNGDLVMIKWKGECLTSSRCCDNKTKNDAYVRGSPFEIFRDSKSPGEIIETNNDSVPNLPQRQRSG